MNPRERQVLWIGGAVVLIAVVALRLGPWGWRAARHIKEEHQARAELLARVRTGVEGAGALQDSSVVIKGKLLALAPKILAGNQEPEVLADLTGRLGVAAAAHRVRLSRTTALADSARAGRLRRVSIRAALEGDTRGTLGFLAALAGGPAVLTPVDLRILAPNAATPAAGFEVLQTEVTVRGWYLARDSSP